LKPRFLANESLSIVIRNMAEEKVGKRPADQKGGFGAETDPGTVAEVAGRGKRMLLYTCFACGVGNYVDPDWTYFACWRCGATLNYTP
jgi:hypothetical protein